MAGASGVGRFERGSACTRGKGPQATPIPSNQVRYRELSHRIRAIRVVCKPKLAALRARRRERRRSLRRSRTTPSTSTAIRRERLARCKAASKREACSTAQAPHSLQRAISKPRALLTFAPKLSRPSSRAACSAVFWVARPARRRVLRRVRRAVPTAPADRRAKWAFPPFWSSSLCL